MNKFVVTVLGVVLLLGLTRPSHAQRPAPAAKPLARSVYHQDKATEDQLGYVQALKVGKTVHISGTVATGALPEQVERIYTELGKALQHYGLSYAHVVRETVFTTDLDGFKKQVEVRKRFYNGTFPTASWVQVQPLFVPEFLVEIELTAELP